MKKAELKENIKLFGSMIIIGILLLYIVFQLFIPSMTVKVFGFKPYVVITESMEPVINVNDMVFVHRFNLEDAEVGDIISFNADIDYNGTPEVVTHYIYSITDENGTTIIRTNRYFDEDTTPVPDTWLLTEDDVLGAYWFHIPKVGVVVEFLKSPFGIAAVLVNVGVITAVTILLKKDKNSLATTTETPEESTEEKS